MDKQKKQNVIRTNTTCKIIGGGNAYTANGFLHTLTDLIAKYEAEFEKLAQNENGNAPSVSVFCLLFRIT